MGFKVGDWILRKEEQRNKFQYRYASKIENIGEDKNGNVVVTLQGKRFYVIEWDLWQLATETEIKIGQLKQVFEN